MSTTSPTPPTLNVDLQGEFVELQVTDDRGNPVQIPAGGTVAFASSNPTVADVVADPNNPARANFQFNGPAGDFQLSVNVTGVNDANGNPVPAPDPVTLTVNPGAASGERLGYGQNQPAPTPTPAPPTPDPTPTPPAPTPEPTPAPTPTPEPTPAPTPTTAAQPTQPTYVFSGDYNALDTTEQAAWPPSGFQTDETPPRPLYYNSNDAPDSGQDGQASGNGASNGQWVAWTGGAVQVDQPTGV